SPGPRKFSRSQGDCSTHRLMLISQLDFPQCKERFICCSTRATTERRPNSQSVRAELCQEAMRLAALLLEHPLGATTSSYALSALICLNKARLPARLDASGRLNPFFDQDRSLWDQNLMSEGLQLLDLSAKGSELSEYHLEAAIAAVHATAPSIRDTD